MMTAARVAVLVVLVGVGCWERRVEASGLPEVAEVVGTIASNPDRLQGADADGRVLLYAPDPVETGSSISHFDTTAVPNLLMEPAISPDLAPLATDLTPALFRDIGWQAGASLFSLFSLDPPGTGLDDPTPFPGAPGNPAVTLGQARVNVMIAAAGAWSSVLDSTVNVDVLVTWLPLPCGVSGAVLGAAGTTFVFSDDGTVFPLADTFYHAALAEALSGLQLTGANGDIIIFFNSDVDAGCLAAGSSFYYGLDGNPGALQIDFAPVVLHEFAHGLGFSNFTDETNGSFLAPAIPGIYDVFTFDNDQGLTWPQMTAAQRATSARNVLNVAWNGPQVTAEAASLLESGVAELTVTTPTEVAGVYNVGIAAFGPSVDDAPVFDQPIACLLDHLDPLGDGCSEAASDVAGKIALVDRGGCTFAEKAASAQAAGAVALIIVNTSGEQPNSLGGSDPSIQIPVISIGRSDGARLRTALACRFDTTPAPVMSSTGFVMSLLLLAAVAARGLRALGGLRPR